MSTSPENEFWLICPVCHKPNPEGTKYCKHCWGAALGSQQLVSGQDLERVLHERMVTRRRRKTIALSILGTASAIILALIVIPILLNYTDVLSSPPRTLNTNSLPGEWAMFRHDLSNSGTTGTSTVIPEGTLKWKFETGDTIHSSVAVSGDTIYFGSWDYNLYAVDIETGQQKWAFRTGSRVNSTPAVVSGVVYFGSNDGHLYAVDADTGKELWKFRTRYPVVTAPAVTDGKVFFGADDYYFYTLDAIRGTKIWRFNTGGTVESSAVVANGLVYVASSSNYVYVLNAANGRFRRRFKVFDTPSGTLAINDGTGLVCNINGALYAMDGHARNWLFEYTWFQPFWLQVWALGIAPAPPGQSGMLWGLKVGKEVGSSPVIQGESLFIGADNDLLAINLQDKKKTWTFSTEGAVRSIPAIVGETLFVGSGDGHLYAVNSATGEKLWDFATGGQITASPTVDNGVVFIGSHDGTMYAIE
jgi:outer membrane protein assembly factor BamB